MTFDLWLLCSDGCKPQAQWDTDWGWEWSWSWRAREKFGETRSGGGFVRQDTALGPSFSTFYRPWRMYTRVPDAAAADVSPVGTGAASSTAPSSRSRDGGATTTTTTTSTTTGGGAHPGADAGVGDHATLAALLRTAKESLQQLAAATSTPTSATVQRAPVPPQLQEQYRAVEESVDCGAFAILVGLLTSCIRHVTTPDLKLTALALMARFACHADDETRLQVPAGSLCSDVSLLAPRCRHVAVSVCWSPSPMCRCARGCCRSASCRTSWRCSPTRRRMCERTRCAR